MNPTLAILTIGVVPVSEILPLLAEYVPEDRINCISLLDKLSAAQAIEEYGLEEGHEKFLTLLNGNVLAELSRQKVEVALQRVIEVLDNQGYDLIILMSTFHFTGLVARNAALLEPRRIIPPLVAAIVDKHQVGVILPVAELLHSQSKKWHVLDKPPLFALANPVFGSEDDLINAGRSLIALGADVLMLDCLGYHQKHRDALQKTLDIPVLLSNVLLARLAAELLV